MNAMHYTIAELAQQFELVFKGDGARVIDGVGTLAGAGSAQLSFLSNSKYGAQLADTRAGVVILREEDLAQCPTPLTVGLQWHAG